MSWNRTWMQASFGSLKDQRAISVDFLNNGVNRLPLLNGPCGRLSVLYETNSVSRR